MEKDIKKEYDWERDFDDFFVFKSIRRGDKLRAMIKAETIKRFIRKNFIPKP